MEFHCSFLRLNCIFVRKGTKCEVFLTIHAHRKKQMFAKPIPLAWLQKVERRETPLIFHNPSTRTKPISACFMYFEMSLHKCLEFDKFRHWSLIKGFTLNGGAHATSQLAFMVTLNKPCCMSNFVASNISGAVKGWLPSYNSSHLFTNLE